MSSIDRLTTAAMEGDLSRVQSLLEVDGGGFHIDDVNKKGCTALMEACAQNHHELVKFLIRQGANVNATNEISSPLMIVAESTVASDDAAQATTLLLLDNGADIHYMNTYGATALAIAVCHGKQQVAQTLLERGADANCRTWDENSTVLMAAAERGFSGIARLLVAFGAHVHAVNDCDQSVTSAAVAGDHFDVLLILAEELGLSVSDELMKGDLDGNSPLVYAPLGVGEEESHVNMVLYLLQTCCGNGVIL